MAMKMKNTQFAVLGLGQFGMSMVQTLSHFNVNILACDKDASRVHEAVELATQALQADIADEAALEDLGLGNFDVVIIAMGEDFEASLLATMVAKEQGSKHVLVKAQGPRQKKILESIGADHVVLPERDMGAKIALNLVSSNLRDYVEESDHFFITEMHPFDDWVDKTIGESRINAQHNLMVLAIRRGDKIIGPVTSDQLIKKDDLLVVLSER